MKDVIILVSSEIVCIFLNLWFFIILGIIRGMSYVGTFIDHGYKESPYLITSGLILLTPISWCLMYIVITNMGITPLVIIPFYLGLIMLFIPLYIGTLYEFINENTGSNSHMYYSRGFWSEPNKSSPFLFDLSCIWRKRLFIIAFTCFLSHAALILFLD